MIPKGSTLLTFSFTQMGPKGKKPLQIHKHVSVVLYAFNTESGLEPAMFQIPKFNFKISLVLISMLWYPKYIDI